MSWVQCTNVVFTTVAWPFLFKGCSWFEPKVDGWIGFSSTQDCSCWSLALVIGQRWVERCEHVYSVGTYSWKPLFCLELAQSCGGTETRRKWGFVCWWYSACSRGLLRNVAPKWRTVVLSFEYHGVKYHSLAAFWMLSIPFYGNRSGLFNSTRWSEVLTNCIS